ncbi:hypothetical protein GCM10008955_40620 [Deinococcus malanensis]|uniref:Uncharacterized protein n=1 Tax=Deinococcus malanensis TaxID=1706855 RepID=A0ABQ2F1V4_9DEIO|nr:hypothetical protein [Deinococcus malanensis]GGK42733.1 hypothetical protein GCM10008955_40620 [Deinococcus malanensis]
MLKDDMAIHAGIPEKAVKAALQKLDEADEGVTWDLRKTRAGRPIKVYFEAQSMAQIHAAKKRLEQILGDAGFDLYP